MSDHPWANLSRPQVQQSLIARRVDAGYRWDFFWAVDVDGRYLLILEHFTQPDRKVRLPRLRGIEVSIQERDENKSLLIFRLLDSGHLDIFERLCRDIMEHCAVLATSGEVLAVANARTWRWHHLLRGGSGKLGEEAQKGLIGELLVLERLLIPTIGCMDSVLGWLGPLDAPKDFEVGRVAIEAKARRGPAMPFITISSEYQLDCSGVEALFLFVVDLARAPSGDPTGMSVVGFALRLRTLISEDSPAALERFDSLLASAGLDLDDDYDDVRWLEGERRLFRVADAFPRLVKTLIPAGVSSVRYALSLDACEPHLTSEADLIIELKKGSDGHRA